MNWLQQLLHAFKSILGQFSSFIRIRLLDSKIEVAQKVLGSLESIPTPDPGRTVTQKLHLSEEEMATLSHGSLGIHTFYFREHVFWKQFAEVKVPETPNDDGWWPLNLISGLQ